MTKRPIVEQYMSRSPHTIDRSGTLDEAHKLMRKFDIRHLPVLSEGDLVGLLSIRDLHLLETLKDIDSSVIPVSDAMTERPYVVRPDASIREVAAMMAANKYGSVVVTDEDKVVGIFTTTDALIALLHIFK